MARTGGSWHDLGPGYDDEPDLLLTLDGSLHGYPPTMLRVTHLHHLQNCTRRAVRAALVQYEQCAYCALWWSHARAREWPRTLNVEQSGGSNPPRVDRSRVSSSGERVCSWSHMQE
eukprot:ctg_838.g347